MERDIVQNLSAHLNHLAGNVDPNLRVVPLRLECDDWVFQVLDGGLVRFVSAKAKQVQAFLLAGA